MSFIILIIAPNVILFMQYFDEGKMKQYLEVLKDIMKHGIERKDRTGVGTRSLFAKQMRFKMSDGFPAMTTKKLAFNAVKAELLWFISGSSNVKELQKLGCRIWDANAEADYWKPKARFEGDLGRVYGVQWRNWQGPGGKVVDQLSEVLERIKKEPWDRRLIVSAWNPGEIEQMALPPCHMIFQFYVACNRLSLHMLQRSCDMFLGVPFNIASYALLLHMCARVTDTIPDELIITLNDAHIYLNHFDQVKKQLKRKPLTLPKLWLNPARKNIDEFTMDDIRLDDYKHRGVIKAPMAV